MAKAAVSTSASRNPASIQRSFTSPARYTSAPGNPTYASQSSSQAGQEILFSYGSCKIVRFSPPNRSDSPRAFSSQNEQSIGTLPWTSPMERTVALGAVKLYKVPELATYLSAGAASSSFLRTIMSKSVCWCVDNETKFVLQNMNEYYRIELPNRTEEDRQAAEEFKLVLARVLQFETTPCPFKRGHHVEIPEKEETIQVPWKVKHPPITAQQQREGSQDSPDREPRFERSDKLEVRKSSGRYFAFANVDDEDQKQSSNIYEDRSSGTENETMARAQHVGEVISNYESLKSPDMLTPYAGEELPKSSPHAHIWMHTAADDQDNTSQNLYIRSEFPLVQTPKEDRAPAPESPNSEDEGNDDPRPPSTPEGEGSISTVDEIQETPERYKFIASTPLLAGSERGNPQKAILGLSLTTPLPRQYLNFSLDSLDLEQHHEKEALDTVMEVDPVVASKPERSVTPVEAHQPSASDFVSEFGIEEPSRSRFTELTHNHEAELVQMAAPVTPTFSHSRTSTPEWLGLSPTDLSSQPASRNEIQEPLNESNTDQKFLLEDLRKFKEEFGECMEDPENRSPKQLLIHGNASAEVAIKQAPVEIPSIPASPGSQLRERVRLCRMKSSTPPLMDTTPENAGRVPDGNVALRLLQNTYSLLLVPIIPVVALILTLVARIKYGFPQVDGPVDLKRESQVPCAWQSDLSAEESSSCESADDFPASCEEAIDEL